MPFESSVFDEPGRGAVTWLAVFVVCIGTAFCSWYVFAPEDDEITITEGTSEVWIEGAYPGWERGATYYAEMHVLGVQRTLNDVTYTFDLGECDIFSQDEKRLTITCGPNRERTQRDEQGG